MTDDVRHQIVALLPRLRRFARVLTRDTERGDELVQETCVRALSQIERWQPGTRLDSWMFRIAQNIFIDGRRAHKVRGDAVEVDAASEIAGDDGRKVTEGRLTLGEVERTIARLPPDQRVVVALVCVEGLSYKEAAETVGVPIGTVMSRLARARVAIHEAINGDPSGSRA